MGPVDGQLNEVGSAEAGQLRVEVGEQPGLHQRIVGDLDAGNEVPGVERDLLRFGEVVGGVAVERQLADALHLDEFLGDDLGRVQQIDSRVGIGAVVRHDLHAQFVFERGARFDAVGHVPPVEVGVDACGDLGFLPHQRVHARDRLPVELHQARLPLGVDQAEGMDAEALHRAIRPRDAAVAHVPEHVMGGLGVQRDEVPERVVRRLRLRDLAIGMRLTRMDDVGELDAVLDEEHGHVVADEVEVSFVGVELHREPTGVADGVRGTAGPEHRGEATEDVGLLALGSEEVGLGDGGRIAVGLEGPVGGGAAGVHDALGNAFVVEVGDLLAEMEVLEERRPAVAHLQRMVGVG